VVANATSCLEVSSFMYPYTAYEDSYIHSAFEKRRGPPIRWGGSRLTG